MPTIDKSNPLMLDKDIIRLQASLGRLDAKSAAFARSLLEFAETKGRLSEKQWAWVQRLADTAPVPAAPIAASAALAKPNKFGGFAAIVELLHTAQNKLSRPRITFTTSDGKTIQLSVAGSQARFPGSINVVDCSNDRKWLGRIHRSGEYEAAAGFAGEAIANDLQNFAADPTGMAKSYGRRTGLCMFCNRELTDATSVKVGYGPICADHYGLPYG